MGCVRWVLLVLVRGGFNYIFLAFKVSGGWGVSREHKLLRSKSSTFGDIAIWCIIYCDG